MPDMMGTETESRQRLESPPPRPPRNQRSIMQMATDRQDDGDESPFDMSSKPIRIMKAMGDARNALLALASELPTLAPGVQQMISGLQSVVPQQVADLVSGSPAGASGSGLGAPSANQAPTAPPVQAGA